MKNFVLLQWLAILFFATDIGYAQPRKWYVDPNVQPPLPSGNTWDQATSLADALLQAAPYDTIWCKRGEYVICASVPSNVCLYGGFEGWEDYLNQRELNLDISGYPPFSSNNLTPDRYSILKLDMNNSYPTSNWHILSVNNADQVLIDGFIFKEGGSFSTSGGGLYLNNVSTSVFRNLIFLENKGLSGAGLYANYSVQNTMKNVIFCNNYSIASGGGLFLYESFFVMKNILFVGNQSNLGGGFFLEQSTAHMYFTTTAINLANVGNAGYVSNSTFHMHSSVVYGDTNIIDTIFIISISFPDIVYSKSILFPIASFYQDNTCSNVNPMLANPNDYNCYLQPNSPCINKGNNSHTIDLTSDVIGNVRIENDTVDIGAYEYQININY